MLIGERVKLRPILKSDAVVLNNWKNNYEIFKFLGGGYDPQSLDDFNNHIDSLIVNSGNNKRFVICLNEKAIGMIGIYGINQRNGTCELGMYIGETEHWRKGYGQESLKILENLIANNYNLRKIKLLVVSKNKIAVTFYEIMNYRPVGKYLKDRYINE